MRELALTIGGFTLSTPSQVSNLDNSAYGVRTVGFAVNTLLFGAIIIAIFFIVYGGIKWIMSEGDSKQVETARATIINSALGLGIALMSMFLINVLGAFLGIHLFAQ